MLKSCTQVLPEVRCWLFWMELWMLTFWMLKHWTYWTFEGVLFWIFFSCWISNLECLNVTFLNIENLQWCIFECSVLSFQSWSLKVAVFYCFIFWSSEFWILMMTFWRFKLWAYWIFEGLLFDFFIYWISNLDSWNLKVSVFDCCIFYEALNFYNVNFLFMKFWILKIHKIL